MKIKGKIRFSKGHAMGMLTGFGIVLLFNLLFLNWGIIHTIFYCDLALIISLWWGWKNG